MTLRPLRGTRVANSSLGAVLVVPSVILALDPSVPWGWEAGILLALLGVLLAVRGYRLGVHCDDDTITVYGLLWTRTIPKASVIEITDFPAVRWATESGHVRWTPVIAFNHDLARSVPRTVAAHDRTCVDRLRDWTQQGDEGAAALRRRRRRRRRHRRRSTDPDVG